MAPLFRCYVNWESWRDLSFEPCMTEMRFASRFSPNQNARSRTSKGIVKYIRSGCVFFSSRATPKWRLPEHCLHPVRAQTEISRAALHAQTCKNGFGAIRHETKMCKRTGSKTVQTAKRKQNSTAEKEATKAATEQGKQQCNASVNPSEATSRTHVYNASKTQLTTHV